MVENKVLEEFLDLDDKQLALLIVNYYQEIKGIRNDMVCLLYTSPSPRD